MTRHSREDVTGKGAFGSRRFRRISTVCIALAFAIVILRGWVHPLPSGFWLDELGTHYIVSGSWNEFLGKIGRIIQSPLYCGFLWVWAKVAGMSEPALRIPSVLAMGATAFFVYRLALRLADRSTAVLAALAFCAMPEAIDLGVQARPYAFGMLAATVTMTLAVNWLAAKTPGSAFRLGLAVAVLMYLQPLNATLAVAIAGIVLLRRLRGDGVPAGQALLIAATAGVAVAPIVPYYWSAAKEGALYAFASRPSFFDLGKIYADQLLPGCLLLGLVAGAVFFNRLAVTKVDIDPTALPALAIWMAVPPLALFAYSKVSSGIFVPRYYAIALPAVAIAIGLAIRHFEHPGVRLLAICAYGLGGVLSAWSTAAQPQVSDDDWRGAARVLAVRNYEGDTPVFVRSGFVEAKHMSRLADPTFREFLLAPARVYHVRGAVRALPDSPSCGAGEYGVRLIEETIAGRSRFFLLGNGEWPAWFDRNASGKWKATRLHPLVTEFKVERGH